MCILVQVKLKYSILNLLIVESHSSRKKWYLSFTQRGWNSLLLKKLTSAILRVSWRGGWQHGNPPLPPLNPGRSPGQSWQCWLTELPVACPADFWKVTLQKWSSTPKDLRILGRKSLICHFLNRVSVFTDQSSLLFRWTPRCL